MGGLCSGFSWGMCGVLGNVGLIVSSLVLFGLVVLMWLWAIGRGRQLGWQRVAPRARMDPLDLARQRLAAGDITTSEFEEIRRQLQW